MRCTPGVFIIVSQRSSRCPYTLLLIELPTPVGFPTAWQISKLFIYDTLPFPHCVTGVWFFFSLISLSCTFSGVWFYFSLIICFVYIPSVPGRFAPNPVRPLSRFAPNPVRPLSRFAPIPVRPGSFRPYSRFALGY